MGMRKVRVHFELVTDHKPLVPLLAEKPVVCPFATFPNETPAFQLLNGPRTRERIIHAETAWPEESRKFAYHAFKNELVVHQDLILKDRRIWIPKELRQFHSQKLHEGDQGTVKTCRRAAECVWWLGINNDIETFIANCKVCARKRLNRFKPLMPSELLAGPWREVRTDFCEIKNRKFLVMMDYFSKWIEIIEMQSTSAVPVIEKLKSVFARFGIPDIVRSDNADPLKRFAKEWKFQIVTSSPKFPQSNDQA